MPAESQAVGLQNVQLDRPAARLSLAHVLVAFLAFGIAAIFGMLQGLDRGGVITLPKWLNYYQVLTAHGVYMALLFTTFFIIGFLFSGVARTTGGSLPAPARRLGWIGWWLMVIGTLMATVEVLAGNASVLYTFYAPMKASPYFYIGAALLVVGSWFGGYGMFVATHIWKKKNRGKPTPLLAFMAVATMALWQIATIGVALEVLLQLIPWSFGWVPTINVLLSRMLLWFFGHPLVYFWLLPAYAMWYVNIPRIIGGKVFSDTLARTSFLLFILLSTPVGFHHQLLDPGIPPQWKFFHVVLTLMVVVPSLMTAFSLFATFEMAGRAKGGTGLFGWFKKLPWGDARFMVPFMGMVAFIPGGAGGIVNASYQLDEVVHNTIWVTGHFHLTVGTAVAMTFFGIAYWLIPHLTGRKLTPAANRAGLIQAVVWGTGMLLMSGSMHYLGLLGVPRRTAYTTYMNDPTALSWMPLQGVMAVGGVLLFIGAMIMVGNVIYLTWFAPKGFEEYPVGEPAQQEEVPRLYERWPVIISLAAVLILVAYAYPLIDVIQNAPPGAPGIRTW
ncbi:b(o/a)3-type cytochrome-c oxidase subunit 1 [Kyrpidia spormannii]|uniref:Cytochrome c oxidase subunit 1 n=2 Tax=Kyrpidia spormannii TaxID=2055160 RepID=A0A6F9E279_9BACL|nr:b(o/a)3-type cytochrome-c oxidase subunit 1 [Kyrpidia spormannii]CAB3390409.1 Cytochrome c oxidase subunit 1 [Kyrpidia spormannii]CAB3391327.1 Cytochrome c oxidase subunit 1 [Kyrpidia spormannii]